MFPQRDDTAPPGLDALPVVVDAVFWPTHGPSTELGSAGYPAEFSRADESSLMGTRLFWSHSS